jgi:hypothetical protein
VLLLGALGAAPPPASAHRTSLAASEIHVAGDTVRVQLTISGHDLAAGLGIDADPDSPVPVELFRTERERLAGYLASRLPISADGRGCTPGSPEVLPGPDVETLRVEVRHRCPARIEVLGIGYLLLLDIDPAHRNLGTLIWPGGREPYLFDRHLTRLEVPVGLPEAGPGDSPQGEALVPRGAPDRPGPMVSSGRFWPVFGLGVEHIVLGFDHLLFLLALLLACPALLQAVKVVTAFTVTHSLTLALAWFGLVPVPERLVESLIAASIAWVAVDNLRRPGGGARWGTAGVFGLVHGLGFASSLESLGLAGGDLALTLLAFNLGVEAGQLAVVAVVYGPLAWCLHQPWARCFIVTGSSAVLVMAGAWLWQRAVLG